MRKIVITLMILFLSFGSGVVSAMTTQEKVGAIIADTTGVPTTPEPKGFVGSLIADIFWASGKIKTIFISAFQDIDTGANNNTIPRWIKLGSGEGKFAQGTIRDSGTGVSIGGAIDPNYTFSVYGTTNLRGDTRVAGNINFTGELYRNGVLFTPTLPSDIVRTTGDQTVGGIKTFTAAMSLSGTTPVLNFLDTNTNAQGYITANSASGSIALVADRYNTTLGSRISFAVDSTTPEMVVLGNGKIGIGTEDPKARMHIYETTDASLSSTGHALTLGNHGGNNLVFDNNEILARNNGVSTTLYIQGSSSTGNTLINSDGGNVGIGILTPTQKLDVYGSIRAGTGSFIGNGSTLTNLNASNLTSGTINSSRLPNDVVRTSGNQIIGGTKTFSSTITGSITGNAGTATKLATARKINGVDFDGTKDITITAAGDDLGDHEATKNLKMNGKNINMSGGTLNMVGGRIENLPTPTQNDHAATKEYVDNYKLKCTTRTTLKENVRGKVDAKISCETGETVTGGYCATAEGNQVLQTHKKDNGWYCYMNSGSASKLFVSAICCELN